MERLPCAGCKGLCCGPVPITQRELQNIKDHIIRVSRSYRAGLKSQTRYFGTCIFYDLDKDKCGIYLVRPSICRAFGNYKNLTCFKQPVVATNQNWEVTENPVGLLSVDFTWKDFG